MKSGADWPLQGAQVHLLCIKSLLTCPAPRAGCVPGSGAVPLGRARCFVNEVFLMTSSAFFCAGGNGQGSIDEFAETAAGGMNKALFSTPEALGTRTQLPTSPSWS